MTISASLATLLPQYGNESIAISRSIAIEADTWPHAVAELRRRYAGLAQHVFDESDRLRSGFLVAIKEEVRSRRDGPPNVQSGDELYLFTQIAGG